MQLFSPTHPIKIEQPLANNSVVVKDLVELAKLEEKYFFEVGLLHFPKLVHSRRKVLPSSRRDVQSRRVVVGLSQLHFAHVHQVLGLQKVWKRVVNFLLVLKPAADMHVFRVLDAVI